MSESIAWQHVPDPHALFRRTARALGEGRVVALPTETGPVLAASARVADAVARLRPSANGTPVAPLTLAVRGAGEARDWVPGMSSLGRRLARRLWPGPLTLAFGEGLEQGLASRLSGPVRQALCPDGTLRLRTPAHPAPREVLRHLAGPLVLADRTPDATADLELAEDALPPAGPATVVAVRGNAWQVLEPGQVPVERLAEQSACVVVFVCTGNTCRSPLAEALCKKQLADRLGCPVEDLPARGFFVLSAGLAAMMGGAAAAEAVEVARAFGASLEGHCSRPLTPDLAAGADYLVAMTRSHLQALAEHAPLLGARPRLLSPWGDDVADPIGQDQAVYQECARQIWQHLESLVAELHP